MKTYQHLGYTKEVTKSYFKDLWYDIKKGWVEFKRARRSRQTLNFN